MLHHNLKLGQSSSVVLTDLSIQLSDLLLAVCELSGELADRRLQGLSSVLG